MNALSPRGFVGITGHLGLKTTAEDFLAIVSRVPTRSNALFTRSRFAGPSVLLSRATAASQQCRGIAVLAGNANVATGRAGAEHAAEVRSRVAQLAGIPARALMIASTGVIGRPYPMDVIHQGLDKIAGRFAEPDFERAADAMMTGDTMRKVVRLRVGDAVLVGIAKGGGVSEHDRVTRVTAFFTDAHLPGDELDTAFGRVIAHTFHELNVENDAATSDTVALFANGLAGPVKSADFELGLYDAAMHLARQIADENEEATMPAIEVASSPPFAAPADECA